MLKNGKHICAALTPKTHAVRITLDGLLGSQSIKLRIHGVPGELVLLTESQHRKILTAPCPVSDCLCGETFKKAVEPKGGG